MRKGLILMLVLIAFFPAGAWAQEAFAVGDRVEAQDCAHGCLWRAGTVREQYGLSVVVFDSNVLPDGTQLDDMWASVRINSSTKVRRIAGAATFQVGDRVDDKGPRPSHARGTVIAAEPPSYRVNYDGCGDTFDDWHDASELSLAASIDASNAEVQFLVGRWDMFVAGAPTTVADDNQLYREYSTGAKAPPLEIRADGSYAWTDQFNQAPIQGKWTPSAKIADASVGSERFDGLIIKDREGNPWKVYRRDARQMEMRILCGDASQMGTRIQ